ncbi:MAG: 50S ribosomal protein L24e [Candidatus Methanomethylicia archaeon]
MVRLYKCSFCGQEFSQGNGIMYIKTDGSVLKFCSSKCRKNAIKLRRTPHKVTWVKKA